MNVEHPVRLLVVEEQHGWEVWYDGRLLATFAFPHQAGQYANAIRCEWGCS